MIQFSTFHYFLKQGYLPTTLISKCGNYCLFPINNGQKGEKMKIGGPDVNNTHWTDEDFRALLPVTARILTENIYIEVAIRHFMVGGLVGKLFIK
jgi:hypothetical protein